MEKLMKDLQITDNKEDVIKNEKESHKVLSTQELLLNIFCSVPVKCILKMRLVCRLWNDILQDDHTWQKMFEINYAKISDPLFRNGQSYRSILLFKEYEEIKLWNNAHSIVKEQTTSPNLQKYKLFGETVSSNSYIYDVISTNIIKDGIAISFISQRPLSRDPRTNEINILKERPTLSNMDFTLVPNIFLEIYIKIIKFNQQDIHKIRLCDAQNITLTYDDISKDSANWIKNAVNMEFGKEYYMYSSYVTLGTCKIYSYESENPLCNFNVDVPPIVNLALSNNLFVVRTKSGKIQITTKSILKRRQENFTMDLKNNEKFFIIINDIALKVPSEINSMIGLVTKASIHSFYLDQNDFMIIGYFNKNNENVFRCWDLRGITNIFSFEDDFNLQEHIIEFYEKLPTKSHSFIVRWRNSKDGSYEQHSYLQQDDDIIPEIIVTCLGGLVLIYHPSLGDAQNKLNLVWKISTGLTLCKMIDTSFWTKDNYPNDGDWLFLSAKKLTGDMNIPIILQFLLPETTNTNNNQFYGYTCIDGHNPNELQDSTSLIKLRYTRLVHRILFDKLPHTGSIVQVMPHLPHSLLVVVCQRKESNLFKRRSKLAIYIYDYHTSSFTLNPQYYSPFLYLLPTGYFIMAPNQSFKDDIVFIPLPNLKSRSKSLLNSTSNTKSAKPKLTPGSSKLKVSRNKPGNKRGKQPKNVKIEKRKRNQSSKIAYSPRDYDIDYDDDDIYDEYDDY
ncbi:hypothetical protein C1645_805097 [Glomus cerebriforme]|uniref:F-box domain-containing protein n=1 Tax=Glomus cerebriforme TaxID=658196 RepID=A0A397T1H3_9GLOM|nr:hypothetical protein C1645_805097 [Glomus cerebriforme]